MKALKHTWKLKCSWKAISLTLSETCSIQSFHGIRMLRKALGVQDEGIWMPQEVTIFNAYGGNINLDGPADGENQ